MKNFYLLLLVILGIAIGCTEKSTAPQKKEIPAIVINQDSIDDATQKAAFVSGLTEELNSAVQRVDSFNIQMSLGYPFREALIGGVKIYIDPTLEKKWRVEEGIFDCTEAQNEVHIGHSYLKFISCGQTYQVKGNEHHYMCYDYSIQYGVLLEKDVFKGKTYSAGTYIIALTDLKWEDSWYPKDIQSESLKWVKCYKDFSDFDKALAQVIRAMQEPNEFLACDPINVWIFY